MLPSWGSSGIEWDSCTKAPLPRACGSPSSSLTPGAGACWAWGGPEPCHPLCLAGLVSQEKSPQPGAQKPERTHPQVWTPEARKWGLCRAALPPAAPGESPCLFQSGSSKCPLMWLHLPSLSSIPCVFVTSPYLAIMGTPTPIPGGPHLDPLNSFTSAKTLFPNRVTFTGSRD